jgi:hypothetical protein
MLEFASNTQVTIEVPHSYNDTDLTLTAFEYELLDADSNVVIAKQALTGFDATGTSSNVVIPAVSNASTAKKDARLLNCYLTSAEGSYIVSQVYILKGNALQLTVLSDSFMTYTESVLIRAKIAEEQEFFDSLNDELKVVALENAYGRLANLKFQVGTTEIPDIKSLSLNAFQALNPDFLAALKKAQIIEANALVENSPVRDKIRAGIISETIGESSMFFRQSGVPLSKHSGISDDAYEVLGRWIYKNSTGAQIWKLNRA